MSLKKEIYSVFLCIRMHNPTKCVNQKVKDKIGVSSKYPTLKFY